MKGRRLALSMIVVLLTYCGIFILRRELALWSYSGAVDWLFLLAMAPVPCLINPRLRPLHMLLVSLAMTVAEIALSILIVVTIYSESL